MPRDPDPTPEAEPCAARDRAGRAAAIGAATIPSASWLPRLSARRPQPESNRAQLKPIAPIMTRPLIPLLRIFDPRLIASHASVMGAYGATLVPGARRRRGREFHPESFRTPATQCSRAGQPADPITAQVTEISVNDLDLPNSWSARNAWSPVIPARNHLPVGAGVIINNIIILFRS